VLNVRGLCVHARGDRKTAGRNEEKCRRDGVARRERKINNRRMNRKIEHEVEQSWKRITPHRREERELFLIEGGKSPILFY